MQRALLFAGIGYLSGSILFAKLFGKLFTKKDITCESPDHNPGTFNAFRYGGILCGILTLFCDIMKGFLPVFCYSGKDCETAGLGLAFVLAAPAFGHILPVFYGFNGGKGIAVSFGSLLGLLPEYRPVLILVCLFIFFSLVMKITPNDQRTLVTYLISVLGMLLFVPNISIVIGFGLMAGLIVAKLLLSAEEKEKCKVEFAWKH